MVPAYHSVAVYLSEHADIKKLQEKLSTARKSNIVPSEKHLKSNHYLLPVCYENSYAPDMKSVSNALDRSQSEIIELHTKPIYTVYGLGFLPGFPYLGGLPASLHLARKNVPTTHLQAGSVGIGGKQTGIYPTESPGGWHIIGNCPIPLFAAEKAEPALLKPGDRIQFRSINTADWESISEAVRSRNFETETLIVE